MHLVRSILRRARDRRNGINRLEQEVGTVTSCRTCKWCLAVKDNGKILCAKYLELQEPTDCKTYKPIKEAGQ